MSKVYNGVMGLVVGDAFGVPYEFKKMGTFEVEDKMVGYGSHNQPEGTWSDDSSMVIATMYGVINDFRTRKNSVNNYDPKCEKDRDLVFTEIMLAFQRWYREGLFTPYGATYDCGKTVAKALNYYDRNDIDAWEAGGKEEMDNGNGSLMRILPFAFGRYNEEDINKLSALTHGHSLSKFCCNVYIKIARKIMGGARPDKAIFCTAVDYHIQNDSELFCLYDLGRLQKHEIKSSGYVVDTLKCALWCLLKTDNYKDCIKLAVSFGSDTDTVAAVAGGLAGLLYGVGGEKGIPEEWLNVLADKEDLENLCYVYEDYLTQMQNIDYLEGRTEKYWYMSEIDNIISNIKSALIVLETKDICIKDFVTSEDRLSSALSNALSAAECIKSVGNVIEEAKGSETENIKFLNFNVGE